MKLFYAFILGLMVLVSACAQTVQPDVQEETAADDTVAVQDDEETAVAEEVVEETSASNEIRVLGDGAFEPNEMTINAGDSVTWVNSDEKEAVVIIFKDGKVYENSNKFKPGEKFEHEFTEAGTYEYWRNIAYAGDPSTIVVE